MKVTVVCLSAFIAICLAGATNIRPADSSPPIDPTVTTVTQPSAGTPVPDAAETVKTNIGLCDCASFNSTSLSSDTKPDIVHSTINVTCDDLGDQKCMKLCTAFAQTAKERGPAVLCSSLGHTVRYQPSVFSRICGSTQWHYTGLTLDLEICCHESKPIDCKDLASSSGAQKL